MTVATAALPDLRLIVTRPEEEAIVWVRGLQAAGWRAEALPLIHIGAPRDPAVVVALQTARAQWTQWQVIMMVSTAAVQHFFAGQSPIAGTHTVHTRFWAPGPGTARALADALVRMGVAPDQIDMPPADAAQFDSEHLWPVVRAQIRAGVRVLVVRGASRPGARGKAGLAGNGREWLIEQCQAHGAEVHTCVAYERLPPAWTDVHRRRVREAVGSGHVWLFSSSEAIGHLVDAFPEQDWSTTRALCTHDRIAAQARQAGFGRVIISRPGLPDVLRVLESEAYSHDQR